MTDVEQEVPEVDRLPPMTYYVLGLLRRAAHPSPATGEELDRLQERHLAHLRLLRDSGELISCGPLEGDSDLRGVLVFRTASVARARELMRTDPTIVAGRLELELFRWCAPLGLRVLVEAGPTGEPTFETDPGGGVRRDENSADLSGRVEASRRRSGGDTP